MTEFEPRTSGVGSDRSTNCATTTARSCCLSCLVLCLFKRSVSFELRSSVHVCISKSSLQILEIAKIEMRNGREEIIK